MLVSPLINKILEKYNPILIIIILLGIYFVEYLQMVMVSIVTDSRVIIYLLRQGALFGTSQLPYIVGTVFADRKIYSKIHSLFNKYKFRNLLVIYSIVLMIMVHGLVQMLFVVVFTGIAFIVLFNLIDKPKWLDNTFSYISKYSINMWLTNMFFM